MKSVHGLLEKGLYNPPTFSNFTYVPPAVTIMELITKTRSLVVSFDIFILC